MENTFFIYNRTDAQKINVERFHLCTWEFEKDSCLIEFGLEIKSEFIQGEDKISLGLYIPWLSSKCTFHDLYKKLSLPENSRFIFNDSIAQTTSLDGGKNNRGVIHKFSEREQLCILPIKNNIKGKTLELEIDLSYYNNESTSKGTSIYFRFSLQPPTFYISARKRGINKSTVIYDIKLNERRNLPDFLIDELKNKQLCIIKDCFCFLILPIEYETVFIDNSSLRNVRTLEYTAFQKYLGDIVSFSKGELMVIFNKKSKKESFSFFSIHSKERMGLAHFAIAFWINIVCGILLFILSSLKQQNISELNISNIWSYISIEMYIILGVGVITLLYFILPLDQIKYYLTNKFKRK